MKTFTPTNTVPTTYPTTGSTFFANPTLPPRPYEPICDCMMSSLSCTLKDQDADDDTLSTVFSTVCDDSTMCAGIQANTTHGQFGVYSMCTKAQQASWVLNQYADSLSDCLVSIGAKEATPVKANGTCSQLLAQAGTAGTATITTYPAPTASKPSSSSGAIQSVSNGGTSSSSSSGSSSSSSSLSTGAKAGIGVGVAIAVLILIGIVALLLIRRRRRRTKAAALQNTEKDGWGKSELPADGVRHDQKLASVQEPQMADSYTRNELAVNQAPVELEAEDVRPNGRPARPGGMGELP